MARSPAQSDFAVTRAAQIALPPDAAVVALPEADAIRGQAGELTTRWVLRLTLLALFALAVLCMVGPHIPAGE